ncbi:hypothetical protein GCM10010151_59720 [Actinoallomurus spadix]|uniref:Uncharacterized protein n=1 Tax=Actinoallomurus spadix TaxID=79912 RepID=A0ABP3H667_9ACTN
MLSPGTSDGRSVPHTDRPSTFSPAVPSGAAGSLSPASSTRIGMASLQKGDLVIDARVSSDAVRPLAVP